MKPVFKHYGGERGAQLPTIEWIDAQRFKLSGGDEAFRPLTGETFP